MGSSIVKIKIMPGSPSTNLDAVLKEAEKLIQENKGELARTEKEPIAFGLVALILTFIIPEDQELESLENALSTIKEVNSAQVIDMRRSL